MRVHLIDGTFELFRHFYSPAPDGGPEPTRAVRGVAASLLGMLEAGATHMAVATDHVIESFRNRLWPGYKTGEGIDPVLFAQFRPLEDALTALGIVVWPMVEFEADDALAAGAALADANPRVTQVLICTPDKDLSQCVNGSRIVQFDRRTLEIRDEAGVERKFGVGPASIPDFLALVGDSADGFPGLPGWGARSAAAVLHRYGSIEAIPASVGDWDVSVRGAGRLAAVLEEQRELALLFRTLARLRSDAPVSGSVDALEWLGPREDAEAWAHRIAAPGLADRAQRLAAARFR
jgi:5'-3' exonuclease